MREKIVKDKISILMGIYNCATTLEEAYNSISQQTYKNWELILCDDGSSDDTFGVAKSLSKRDSRIKLLKNEINKGLSYTLNKCFENSDGEFIARMDGDDLSESTRFEEQIAFLKNQNQFDIVSSGMFLFDENGIYGQVNPKEFPTKEDVVKGSPICHAPVMMRRKCLEDVKGYKDTKTTLRVEDVNLWIRLYAAGYKCYNIQHPLYRMRNDGAAFNRRKYKYRINSTKVRLEGCRLLHASPICYIHALKPMIAGLVPTFIRRIIRTKSYNRK